MTDLSTRIHSALGSEWDENRSSWDGLMRLYEVDADAFYLLACDGLSGQVDPLAQSLANLAHRIRGAIRASYRLDASTGGEGQVVTQSDCIIVPASLIPRVRQFLMDLDDKGVSPKGGQKDIAGVVVSDAEILFKLGSPDERVQDQKRQQACKQSRPEVFHVSSQDLDSLNSQPGYVSHCLLKCARKTILAPTAIYRGLKRGDKAPSRFSEGWAICGKPNQACDNDGKLVSPPPNMVFVVYADKDRFVFDWDWVQEDPHAPGHPLDPEIRFDRPQPVDGDMVLDLPSKLPVGMFDPTVATYSDRGDCIFWYLSNDCGYAVRINEDLTIFRRFVIDDVTGFKIKNVRRILKEEEYFVSDDAPDLRVSVQPILLATLKGKQKTSVRIYDVIIEAFRKLAHPPAVDLSHAESNQAEMAGA